MSYIPAELRRFVVSRANGCCEYCRIRVDDRLLPYHIDHIIAEKHDGLTEAENLCLACYRCNSLKGSDIASADPVTGTATYLFHPRRQSWDEHFALGKGIIEPLTPEGRVTVFLLQLNTYEHITQRVALMQEGRYPCLSD